MDTVRACLVDAFTEEPLAGNGAGVVPDADGLSADRMQSIAAELAQSETAFLSASGSADRRVRYFTPTQEVDLCGHATIALHTLLYDDGEIGPGTHTLETNVGVIDIDVAENGTVWMGFDDPEIRAVDPGYDRVGTALGVDPATLADVGADLPLAVASVGLPFLIVPANFLSAVSDADPDADAVERLCREFDATGVYLFTFDTLGSDATLHGRMFAPLAGVPEDPVTGTASGATGVYLRHFGAFDGDMPEEMVFEQGHFVDRPGRVRVRARDEVRVGGTGVVALDGELQVPEGTDDGGEILTA